ncbi:MAG: methyltransferase domain-containing protein [Gemmatimonadetes bacterium]|nr:methyltransferase domain-containing protein [Gemmatimonadota bacterium]
MVVVTSLQRDIIFDAVQAMYTDVARHPERTFHFPTGRAACLAVGYPAARLDRIPAMAVESFAGVGYPFAAGVIAARDTVLDIGSGSGTDVFLASLIVSDQGRVHGLDMTRAMRAKLAANARTMGCTNIENHEGNAEAIPLPDASVDVVTTNGVINLVPDKPAAMAEIVRVLRPGGRVQIADIVLATEPSEACRSKPQLWAECIVGATTEAQYIALLEDAGLRDVCVLSRHDYFQHSASAETRRAAASFGAFAVLLTARTG